MSPGNQQQQLVLLDDAIDKIYQIKSGVDTAICRCSDVLLDQAAAESALQSLRRVQQGIQELRQAAPQLQQLSAACATWPPAGQAVVKGEQQQQQQPDDALATVRQQARQAAAALQQQVQASLSLPTGSGLSCPHQRLRHASAQDLQLLLRRVAAAAPQLDIHLLRASSQHLLFSVTHKSGRRVPDAAALARVVAYVDEVRLEVPHVFCASIALTAPGYLDPLRVCLDSADHISSVDAWTSSRHQVFKRISNLAVRALHHFQLLQTAQRALEQPHHHHHTSAAAADQQAAGATADAAVSHEAAAAEAAAAGSSSSSNRPSVGLALECLMLWLACYDDLFSRPCDVSGKLIAWEPATAIPLPPVLRPFWLTLDELAAAARDRSNRRAYHAQLAPWP